MLCVYAVSSHKKRFENQPRGDRPGDRRENSEHDASKSHGIGGKGIEWQETQEKDDAEPSATSQTKQNREEIGEKVRVLAESSYTKKREKVSGRLTAPTKHDGATQTHFRRARSDKPTSNAGPTEEFHVNGQWRVEMDQMPSGVGFD